MRAQRKHKAHRVQHQQDDCGDLRNIVDIRFGGVSVQFAVEMNNQRNQTGHHERNDANPQHTDVDAGACARKFLRLILRAAIDHCSTENQQQIADT